MALTALSQDNELMQLLVKTRTGEISLEVERVDTIMDVKKKIYSKEGIPIQQQNLALCHGRYKARELHDEYALLECNMVRGYTLHLVVDQCESVGMDVYIGVMTGGNVKSFLIQVQKSSTILEVKFKIYHKEHIPLDKMCLLYDNKQLENERTLADYNIERGCTINLAYVAYAGALGNVVSKCSECSELNVVNCPVFTGRCSNAFVTNAKENAWIALCDVFNISDSIMTTIKDNSESPGIRCADVLHRLFHADPTLAWKTIKMRLKTRYPSLAKEL